MSADQQGLPGRRSVPRRAGTRHVAASRIPAELLENRELNNAIKALPHNYNFEMFKALWAIKRGGYRRGKCEFDRRRFFPI